METCLDKSSPAHPAIWGENSDARALLADLRERLALGNLDPNELEPRLSALSASLEQTLQEHQGLADELLSAYEQLGIVFQVTRRIPTVQGESAVVRLFVDNLRQTFAGRDVWMVNIGLAGEWVIDDCSTPPPISLCRVIGKACEKRVVVVEPVTFSFTSAGPNLIRPETGDTRDVMVGPVVAGDSLVCAIAVIRPTEAPEFRAVDMMLLESLASFCGDLIRGHRLVRELGDLSVAMVRSLVSAVDQKDEYTCGHSLRVSYYATALGRKLGMRDDDLRMLQWSALLHDVGKIGIRDSVLKKEGKLTDEEFQHIQEHPVRSHKVVQGIPQLTAALTGILYHHERYDGSGYPSGLKGEEIPLQARVIQIADVFDALTSNRSYRPAFEWRKALSIMKEEAGKTIDPSLQQLFEDMIRGVLENDPDAWQRMVEQASAFTRHEDQLLLQGWEV